MSPWQRHKHVVLLLTAILGLSLQPLMHLLPLGLVLFELCAYALILFVFLSVFERVGERRIALAIGLPAIAANLIGHFSSSTVKAVAMPIFHGLLVAFLAFAVGVILRGVFRRGRIGADQIVGAIAGYLLAGIAWANLYVVVYLFVPDAFSIAEGLRWQLHGEVTRRFLFNYYSFITLATVGYGDVSPLAPTACSLAWLEALFGQFYTAVFIGQLIGLKLAQPTTVAVR